MTPTKTKFYADLLERVLWTFVQGFAAMWIVTGDLDAETLKVALVAGGVAVAKCMLATQIGADNTASTLPQTTDTERGASDITILVVGVLLVILVLVLVGRI